MKNVIAISVAGVLSCVSASAFAQQDVTSVFSPQVDDGGPGLEGQQYVVPAQRLESVPVPSNMPKLNVTTPSGSVAHILPTIEMLHKMRAAGGAAAADQGPLLYHSGGSIMPSLTVYEIFWGPAKLQTGAATGFSAKYSDVLVAFGALYSGHGISNNNTQYFQTINGTTTFVNNAGALAGAVLDASPYPASGCNDPATPGNCLTDAQAQAEILKVINLMGWKVGMDSIFILYTSSGEGSCMPANSPAADCAAPGGYCAYHSFIAPSSGKPEDAVIYANMPFANPAGCFGNGVSPNNDVFADTEVSVASHEVTESITDSLLNAWFTAQGNEIGDLCNQVFGVNNWDEGGANQQWGGRFFELQTEFDDHLNGCVQIGP